MWIIGGSGTIFEAIADATAGLDRFLLYSFYDNTSNQN
jgi:hypothetical protein